MDNELQKHNLYADWETTTNRFVGFIDIMGFKDLVARSSHEEIYSMMKKIDKKKKMNQNILWGQSTSVLVRTTTYSDSIMIYSKDSSHDAAHSIVSTIAALSYDLFLEGIPHKGAIAYGMMTFDTENSIFFGQPLIDAYLLQDELSFYGIVVHATAEFMIDTFTKSRQIPFLECYNCPFKNGLSNHMTIHPMYALKTAFENAQNRQNLYESINKLRYKTSGSIRKYIDNTELYLKTISK